MSIRVYIGQLMKKISLYFTEEILKRLKEISKKTDIPMSAIIRRAVKEHIKKGK